VWCEPRHWFFSNEVFDVAIVPPWQQLEHPFAAVSRLGQGALLCCTILAGVEVGQTCTYYEACRLLIIFLCLGQVCPVSLGLPAVFGPMAVKAAVAPCVISQLLLCFYFAFNLLCYLLCFLMFFGINMTAC
jgi:hypothetical protein